MLNCITPKSLNSCIFELFSLVADLSGCSRLLSFSGGHIGHPEGIGLVRVPTVERPARRAICYQLNHSQWRLLLPKS